jgi:uncharacterized membrane protein YoaK (UPF0700 family)
MFRHQGPSRSERQNTLLAAYLAGVGGFVNSAGFVLVGSFTSHVTGNVGRFAGELVSQQLSAAGAAFSMIVAFFVGAFAASLIVENRRFTRTPTAYGVALTCEAALLATFCLAAGAKVGVSARSRDVLALVLCLAMGVQNSLVTRLSGAVVRTTHLTGVITDLGIETARWLAFWRRSLLTSRISLRAGRPPPLLAKIRLHLTIFATFTGGAVCGCALAVLWQAYALWLPTAAVAAGAGYAFATARHAPLRASLHPHHRPPASSPG